MSLPDYHSWFEDTVKFQVWNKYIGANKTEGECYACGKVTINIMDFDLGHNKAVAKGGKDHVDNLRPICRTCNSSMGTMSIETFKKRFPSTDSAKKTPSKSRTATRAKSKTFTAKSATTRKGTATGKTKAKPKARVSKR